MTIPAALAALDGQRVDVAEVARVACPLCGRSDRWVRLPTPALVIRWMCACQSSGALCAVLEHDSEEALAMWIAGCAPPDGVTLMRWRMVEEEETP